MLNNKLNIRSNTRGEIILRCLIGALVLTAFFLLGRMFYQNRAAVDSVSPNHSAEIQASEEPSSVQFDFYTTLPKMEVATPPPPEAAESNAGPKLKPASIPTPTAAVAQTVVSGYLLQVAAVRQRSDAERFAAQMQNLGYRASIQEYTAANQDTWYRVMLGPYSSLDAAERDQTQLNQHRINNILIKPR